MLGVALAAFKCIWRYYLHDFKNIPAFKDLFAVKYPAINHVGLTDFWTLFYSYDSIFSSQVGIKKVIIFSMIAWVLRFSLFAYGNPGNLLWMIILSCIIYGMAFDFFNISSSLYIETQSPPASRASARDYSWWWQMAWAHFRKQDQRHHYRYYFTLRPGKFNWHGIWLTFAAYSFVVAFIVCFIFPIWPWSKGSGSKGNT